MAEKSAIRKVHDATCPGAHGLKAVQSVCPVCRSAAREEAESAE